MRPNCNVPSELPRKAHPEVAFSSSAKHQEPPKKGDSALRNLDVCSIISRQTCLQQSVQHTHTYKSQKGHRQWIFECSFSTRHALDSILCSCGGGRSQSRVKVCLGRWWSGGKRSNVHFVFGFVTLWYLLRVGLNRVPGVCSHGALLLSEDHRVQKVRHHRQVSGITNSDL